MTSSNLGMIIELLVAGLLVMTIAYCVVLNRRLKNLRADEQILKSTIGELISATEVAERAIIGLKSTTQDAEKQLGQKLRDAQLLHAELKRLTAPGLTQGTPPYQPSLSPAPSQFEPVAQPPRSAETQPVLRQVSAALENLDRELNIPAALSQQAQPTTGTRTGSSPATPAPRDFRVFTRSAFASRNGGN